MPRSPRIEFAGARYHVMSRGNRKEFILGDEGDKRVFLETLGEASEKMGWLVHAYVLMGNHFHLLLETPEPNLSIGMRWLQGTYGSRYNRLHQLVGHVWQGRFKSPAISDEEDDSFLSVSRYIHLNPARAGVLADENPRLSDYLWSSFPALCGTPSRRPAWLQAKATLQAYGLPADDQGCRRKYRQRMELSCRECLRGELDEEGEEARRKLTRGWYIGETSFRDRLKDDLDKAISGRKKHSLSGAGLSDHREEGGRDLIEKSCTYFGVSLEELRGRKYSDGQKQLLTAVLHKKTGVSYDWIIEELNMGSRSSVYNAVRAMMSIRDRRTKKAWKQLQEF